LSWSEHVLSKSKTGLHPSIKEAIEREADMDSHHLPKPITMLCRIKELLSHDVDVLFPLDCLDIVSNQITDYWGRRLRTKIHDSRSNRSLKVAFKPNVKKFREHHTMSMRAGQTLKLENSVSGARLFFESVLDGTKTKSHKNNEVLNRRTPEHEMFCLTVPRDDDPHYGMAVADAHLKDADGLAFDNIVIFTSLNLIRQVKVVKDQYASLAMACIDSTQEGSDANGGKLLSFGYVSMKPMGKKTSKYQHSYHPLVFARALNENYSSAVFALRAVASAVKLLFGFKISFLGGLVSYHANSFVNAFDTVFPGAPRGQCYPHVIMKFKDQRGQQKRGTPGYLKHVWRAKSL
jgi:hypothetical protein